MPRWENPKNDGNQIHTREPLGYHDISLARFHDVSCTFSPKTKETKWSHPILWDISVQRVGDHFINTATQTNQRSKGVPRHKGVILPGAKVLFEAVFVFHLCCDLWSMPPKLLHFGNLAMVIGEVLPTIGTGFVRLLAVSSGYVVSPNQIDNQLVDHLGFKLKPNTECGTPT